MIRILKFLVKPSLQSYNVPKLIQQAQKKPKIISLFISEYVKKTRSNWYNAAQTDIISFCFSSFDWKVSTFYLEMTLEWKNLTSKHNKENLSLVNLAWIVKNLSKVTTIMLGNLCWISFWFIEKLGFFRRRERLVQV